MYAYVFLILVYTVEFYFAFSIIIFLCAVFPSLFLIIAWWFYIIHFFSLFASSVDGGGGGGGVIHGSEQIVARNFAITFDHIFITASEKKKGEVYVNITTYYAIEAQNRKRIS